MVSLSSAKMAQEDCMQGTLITHSQNLPESISPDLVIMRPFDENYFDLFQKDPHPPPKKDALTELTMWGETLSCMKVTADIMFLSCKAHRTCSCKRYIVLQSFCKFSTQMQLHFLKRKKGRKRCDETPPNCLTRRMQ
ncbi:hypothetical protein AVEN_109816-1 [Araneus ventricosus]|uniref:Uncharacterized protein n=1 Tax=Araneus ventricosus TaxID=182803 RepID=A0A4Y2GGB7_ARAVE|nr:hypothetical protein AVEN_109816-1 [Araneus ventricosus]